LQKQAGKTAHQTEWEVVNRRHNRLGTQQHAEDSTATFESTMLPNTAPLAHPSKMATVSGNGNMTNASYQPADDNHDLFSVPLSQSVPHHSTDTSDLKTLLQHLLNCYSINVVRRIA